MYGGSDKFQVSRFMKILGIEHIAIATDDLDRDAPFWRHVLNIPHRTTEEVATEGVTTEIYDTGRGKVELLSELGEDSPIHKFMEKRGRGIHHFCLEVDNLDEAMAELKANGIRLVSDEPSTGAEGYRIIFVHPESAGGVLVELAQKP